MVAVGAGDVKPNRQFSDFILGGLWPETPQAHGRGGQRAAHFRSNLARGRARRERFRSAILGNNDGAMIEAMHVIYQGDSKAVEAQSDLFTSMADAIDECARHR